VDRSALNLTLILALPLLLPMGLLFLLKGALGLRDGRFELYTAVYEGYAARVVGALSVVLSLLMLGFCAMLLARGLGR
jgi:hypothetical protein